VRDVVAGAGLRRGDGVDLRLFRPAVRGQQGGQDREQIGPLLRMVRQLVEQPLHLAVVLHDQIDNITGHVVLLCQRISCPANARAERVLPRH
jgi:hypothetical protein